ncbi:MAG: hypothetical protein KKF33_10110, partial [Alphaproteobacteria bacterium]|nr:hypothetical protein [Alphaproteobacteria bacterium]
MSYPPIVYPIVLDWPDLTVFLLFNVLCAGLSSAVIVALAVGNRNRLLRPALILSVALNIIFQWPLVLLSNPLSDSLQSPWQFSLFAHLPALSAVVYVALTPRLDPPRNFHGNAGFEARAAWPIAAMLVLFTAVFLGRVPFDCTALYASIVDPTAALLAREVTIKFAGSTIATAAYGAVANSLAPAMVGVLLLLSFHLVSSRRWFAALLALLAVLPCITVVLLAGAKGLLVPTFMVGIFAALGAGKTPVVKLLSVIGAVAVLMAAMVSLELARERDGQIVDYDFNSCVARLGAKEEGTALLQSMSKGGLGLSAGRIEWYLGEAAVPSSS